MERPTPWLCTSNNKNIKLVKTTPDFKRSYKKTPNCIDNIIAWNTAFLLVLFCAEVLDFSASVAATASQPAQVDAVLTDELKKEKLNGDNSQSNQPHERIKRFLWITNDGRLALPPGTSLTFTPTIALPLVRHPPEGFFSNMSISFPVTIDFDKLGLTDNQNPLGDLPPLFARTFANAAGSVIGNYVASYLHYKRKRDIQDINDASPKTVKIPTTSTGFHIKDEQRSHSPVQRPVLPERYENIFHGGERVMLYVAVEDFLSTFGLDGKACLLRTICETHSRSLQQFGVFGEMVKLFLTVKKSPFADLIPEYVDAQEVGEGKKAPGECFPYYKACPKSIFQTIQENKYSQHQNGEINKEIAEEINAFRQAKKNTWKNASITHNDILLNKKSSFLM